MLIIGIDPGISGAICFFEDGQIKEIIGMPVMADGKKTKDKSMDLKSITRFLQELINFQKKI